MLGIFIIYSWYRYYIVHTSYLIYDKDFSASTIDITVHLLTDGVTAWRLRGPVQKDLTMKFLKTNISIHTWRNKLNDSDDEDNVFWGWKKIMRETKIKEGDKNNEGDKYNEGDKKLCGWKKMMRMIKKMMLM